MKWTKLTAFVIMSVLVPCLAVATPIDQQTFYFNESNTFNTWVGSIPPGYGSVKIYEESTNGYIFFEVSANDSYFIDSKGWDKFYFNTDQTGFAVVVDETAGNWATNLYIPPNGNVSEFGLFNVGEQGTGLGNNVINPLNFHIVGTDLSVNDFIFANTEGYIFVGHLKGFDRIGGEDSTFLAVSQPVPEPSTMLLLGSGLLGLGLLRRRRNS